MPKQRNIEQYRDTLTWFFTIVLALSATVLGSALIVTDVEIPSRVRDGIVLVTLGALLIRGANSNGTQR